METQTQRFFIVGVFVAVTTMLLVLSIVLIGGNQMFFSGRFTVTAEFDDAQGLAVGSIVSLAGIQVGNIRRIEVHTEESKVVLELSIDKRYRPRVTTNSVASIRTMGALGDKYVYVEPGKGGSPLEDGQKIASSSRKDFLDALEERSTDLKHIGEILKETSELVRSLNENNRAASLVENLAASSQNIKEITSRKEAHDAIISLGRIMRKIDQGDGTLGRLVNDPALYERLMDLSGASARNRFLKPLIQSTVEGAKAADGK